MIGTDTRRLLVSSAVVVALLAAAHWVGVLDVVDEPDLDVERCEARATEEAREVYQGRLDDGANETAAQSAAIERYSRVHRRCVDRIEERIVEEGSA